MSPEAQRIAIAKACGVNVTAFRYEVKEGDRVVILAQGFTSREVAETARRYAIHTLPHANVTDLEEYDDPKLAPDYLNDRNAMAQALSTKKGNEAFWETYWDCLCDITKADKTSDWGRDWTDPELLLNPTAAQQAEAFLRALNLIT